MKNNTITTPSNFDLELLAILKNDIQDQHLKVKAKLINMATKAFDSELFSILKNDLNLIKSTLTNPTLKLAQAS